MSRLDRLKNRNIRQKEENDELKETWINRRGKRGGTKAYKIEN
jgi:hypothetical protein